MKINKIFIGGMALLALSSCNDYLDVEPATNAATMELVYGTESEVDKALNGVYAKILTDGTFGRQLYETFQLNSDVDFNANSNETAQGNQPRRFDVRSDASNVESLWNNLYAGVEAANEFIYNLKNSDIYAENAEITAIPQTDGSIEEITTPEVTNLTQMMGEAKVIRAMFYHELLWYFGDVPFTLEPTSATNEFTPAVAKRQVISDALIKDLQEAAEFMKSDKQLSEAPKRISQEAAYAMIARLALQAGGYSLNHNEGDVSSYEMTRPSNYKQYYQIAYDYAKKVKDAGGHNLTNSYRDVFVNECNYTNVPGDDPIFEIPFVAGSTSCWGYYQGPTNSVNIDDPNYSNSNWGATSGSVRTTYFYRYSFDEKDQRRDYISGFWYYANTGLPTMRMDYAMHNNKWSKLWSRTGLGSNTTSATGINFAYIRYADVLLMLAEADNELNDGPTDVGEDALKIVRRRAFKSEDHADKVETYVTNAAASKEKFLKAVLDERKWEFAGENMRWKDLVRNNMYGEKLFFTFLDYYTIAESHGGGPTYGDLVNQYDFNGEKDLPTLCPAEIVSAYVENYNDPNFPNQSLFMFYIMNPYGESTATSNTKPAQWFINEGLDDKYKVVSSEYITAGTEFKATDLQWVKTTMNWANDDGTLKNQVYYSLYGYIRGDEFNNIKVVSNNGSVTNFYVNPDNTQAAIDDNISRLPAVRYILPYPQEAIARSAGAYKNYYGY
ncbi:MAG: RagB/SusD family nutrient uptake outer membrane protein [Prevotella sp.]|nr:RagB/SusD family nutrient uptake outer membrane protein [Prevotella sp.]